MFKKSNSFSFSAYHINIGNIVLVILVYASNCHERMLLRMPHCNNASMGSTVEEVGWLSAGVL